MGMIFGNTMKKLSGAVLALGVGMAPLAANADHIWEGDSFYGGWWLSDRVQGNMVLGDGQGSGLDLRSTEWYCDTPGSNYSTMRKFIASNRGGISWYVDEICSDGYVRICVYADWGDEACSTYLDYGWRPF